MRKVISTLVILVMILGACKQNNQKLEEKTMEVGQQTTITEVTPEYKTTSFTIKGMTCAVGCAKTIQNKLQRTEGIKAAEVDFESETAKVEFDKNILSELQIKEVVESVAGGETYKVIY